MKSIISKFNPPVKHNISIFEVLQNSFVNTRDLDKKNTCLSFNTETSILKEDTQKLTRLSGFKKYYLIHQLKKEEEEHILVKTRSEDQRSSEDQVL